MRMFWLSLLTLVLSACGFHLRGQYALPPQLNPISVQTSVVTLERDLTAGIQRMGGTVAANAPLRLHITSERINRQTTTIDSRAKAAEYTLFYEVDFQIKYASGIPAEPERTIRLRRTYQFDNTRIVGKYEEENTLIDDLRQQAVGQILARLSRVRVDQLSPDSPAPAAGSAAAPAATAPVAP